MSVVVASPPTSGWQALADGRHPSDSATLILRLVLFFIVITIAGSGLRHIMRNSSSVSAPASARIPATSASDGQNSAAPAARFFKQNSAVKWNNTVNDVPVTFERG